MTRPYESDQNASAGADPNELTFDFDLSDIKSLNELDPRFLAKQYFDSPLFQVGYSAGERWSMVHASYFEHANLMDAFWIDEEDPERDGYRGEQWKSSDAPCDCLAHELFVMLNWNDDNDEANAFWQRFCPSAIMNRATLHGFAEGALSNDKKKRETRRKSNGYHDVAMDKNNRHAWERLYGTYDGRPYYDPPNEASDLRVAWRAGLSWAINAATQEEIRNVRAFLENRSERWLGTVSPYSCCEQVYFAIAGENKGKNEDAAFDFVKGACDFIIRRDFCAAGFVRGVYFVSELSEERLTNTFPSPEKLQWLMDNCMAVQRTPLASSLHRAWRAGLLWVKNVATSEQLAKVHYLWLVKLQAFSTYSRPECAYFHITGGDKNKIAAHRFWTTACPEVFEVDDCVDSFVLGALFAVELNVAIRTDTFPSIDSLGLALGNARL